MIAKATMILSYKAQVTEHFAKFGITRLDIDSS